MTGEPEVIPMENAVADIASCFWSENLLHFLLSTDSGLTEETGQKCRQRRLGLEMFLFLD